MQIDNVLNFSFPCQNLTCYEMMFVRDNYDALHSETPNNADALEDVDKEGTLTKS